MLAGLDFAELLQALPNELLSRACGITVRLKAYNACLPASTENVERHRVTLDMTISAMAETGRDMNAKHKETARGGLAVSMVEC